MALLPRIDHPAYNVVDLAAVAVGDIMITAPPGGAGYDLRVKSALARPVGGTGCRGLEDYPVVGQNLGRIVMSTLHAALPGRGAVSASTGAHSSIGTSWVLQRHRVRVHGRAEGRVLLLVHGFGTHQDAWERLLPALTSRWRVVTLDQAGAGGFEPAAYDRNRYSTLDGYAADLVEVCEELNLHDAVVVGHSVSAMIAARAVVRAPDRFSRIVMIAPSARYIDDPLTGYDGGFSPEDIDELLDTLDQNYLSWTSAVGPMVMGNPERPELAAELTASFRQLHPENARDFARATFRSDSRELLAGVSVPTLVLQCQDDVLAPDGAVRDVVARLPHATLTSLDASGHCPHLSDPDETAAAILDYLSTCP